MVAGRLPSHLHRVQTRNTSLKMRPRDIVGCQNRRPFIFQCVFYILGRRHIEPCWLTQGSLLVLLSNGYQLR